MSLAALIDHTLLRPETRPQDVEALVKDALEHGFHRVCVHGRYVRLAADLIGAGKPRTCTVIGFPSGAVVAPGSKAAEAELALAEGAHELDRVLWVGGFLAGEARAVAEDIQGVAEIVRSGDGRIKVILETGFLDEREIAAASRSAEEAGANRLGTSGSVALVQAERSS